jgi:cytidylate kinase
MGQEADVSAIEEAIRARDHQDRNRAVAPLVPSADAAVIDTSRMSLDEVFQRIMADLKTS